MSKSMDLSEERMKHYSLDFVHWKCLQNHFTESQSIVGPSFLSGMDCPTVPHLVDPDPAEQADELALGDEPAGVQALAGKRDPRGFHQNRLRVVRLRQKRSAAEEGKKNHQDPVSWRHFSTLALFSFPWRGRIWNADRSSSPKWGLGSRMVLLRPPALEMPLRPRENNSPRGVCHSCQIHFKI